MGDLERKRLTTQVLDLLDASARAHAEGRGDDASSLMVEACALGVEVVSAVQGGILIREIPHPHRDPEGWALYLEANRDGLARMVEAGEGPVRCPVCGLPDSYRGQGDGIGSCDCPRCDCCHAGPDECDCRRDFDEMYDDPDEPVDPWCNDTTCGHRRFRLNSKAVSDAD